MANLYDRWMANLCSVIGQIFKESTDHWLHCSGMKCMIHLLNAVHRQQSAFIFLLRPRMPQMPLHLSPPLCLRHDVLPVFPTMSLAPFPPLHPLPSPPSTPLLQYSLNVVIRGIQDGGVDGSAVQDFYYLTWKDGKVGCAVHAIHAVPPSASLCLSGMQQA